MDWIWFVWLLENNNSEIVRNLSFVIFGIVAFIIGVWRAIVHSRQANISQASQSNEIFIKAIEQVDSVKLTIVLGGVISLKNLGLDHSKDFGKSVIEILTSVLKSRYGRYNSGERHAVDSEIINHILSSLINTWPKVYKQKRLIISEVSFCQHSLLKEDLKYVLFQDCDFDHAYISSNLNDVLFHDCDMVGTRIYGKININKTKFISCNLESCNFYKCEINKTEFRFCDYQGMTFRSSQLSNITFGRGANRDSIIFSGSGTEDVTYMNI